MRTGTAPTCAPCAPSRSLRSPVQQTNCAPGLAVDLWVSAVVVDQHRLTATPRGSKAGRIRHVLTNITRQFRLPRKNETSDKKLQLTRSCPPHLCCTRISTAFSFQHPPGTTITGTQGVGRQNLTRHRTRRRRSTFEGNFLSRHVCNAGQQVSLPVLNTPSCVNTCP